MFTFAISSRDEFLVKLTDINSFFWSLTAVVKIIICVKHARKGSSTVANIFQSIQRVLVQTDPFSAKKYPKNCIIC